MVVPEKDHLKFWPQKTPYDSVLQKLRCHGWNLPSDTDFGTKDVTKLLYYKLSRSYAFW